MDFDDKDNNNISIYNDGCFPDASLILAESTVSFIGLSIVSKGMFTMVNLKKTSSGL
jgi:hypothetical protein